MIHILKSIVAIGLVGLLVSCNDFLDREPLSQITPESYLNEESQLAAYANKLYPDILPSYAGNSTGFLSDIHTDIGVYLSGYDNRFVPGEWKVSQSGGNWEFSKIYSLNYFLEKVLPLWKENKISGIKENIDHYVGEIYFLRALMYFKKVDTYGDYPIITTVLTDEKEVLTEASKRFPRNEVARFILSDLDQAISLLQESSPDGKKNRISQDCAQLLKSRVALVEGTWLKYFKNTAFVPGGEGWPGKSKGYNANYQYPSGSIDNEIDYFLGQAMEAAMAVADKIPLVENNGVLQQSVTDPVNPYHDMFGAEDMSVYSEVLLWRQYDKGLGISHNIPQFAQLGNAGMGLTRGYVNSFLMANGLPIYAPASGYAGDDLISDVRKNRDGRLWLFLKEPGQKNILYESSEGSHSTLVEPIPDITNGALTYGYPTGYALRKYNNYDQKHGAADKAFTGCITFRAVEAYLNYMEACYEKNGVLDKKAESYWKSIRRRAKTDEDFTKTIAATNMSEEAKNNWATYSGGRLVDATLYNIRRERSSELIAEGFRYLDLRRWRSMDQLITTPYHVEGFKLWGPMQKWYDKPDGGTLLIYGLDNSAANVSDPAISEYLRPYEISSKSWVLEGYRWTMAHYLSPIAVQHFLITSDNNDVSTSPIYQNPGWPTIPNQGPLD